MTSFELTLVKNKKKGDLKYILKWLELIDFKKLEVNQEKPLELGRLSDEKIINTCEQVLDTTGVLVFKSNDKYNIRLIVKSEEVKLGFIVMGYEVEFAKILEQVEITELLKDKDFLYGGLSLFLEDFKYLDPTYQKIKDENILSGFDKFGFHIKGWQVVQRDKLKVHINKLTKASIYKVKELPSGSILIQLTKDRKIEEFDNEFYEAYKDFYNYLIKS